ncbi:hypothetical protein FG386_002865 [Cryptosporidium ryanae]|uniref:uncharacterized protein n=1 Tax=Cryptosporidium ryanae TaxID=515981 RepID=UPI003519E5D7|nr:hypothetical protein FG386_002865 [Cryptosporidium ryanae]
MRMDNPWEYWNDVLGSPKTVLAPMVDGSELAFRLLCRKYGCDLGYTPMYHSGLFSKQRSYREANFQTCVEDEPLIVQFCGNDPSNILNSAVFVKDKVKGVDINFGCPQNIAKRGNYGSYLLSNPDLMEGIISTLVNNSEINCMVSCKIRLLDKNDLQKTVNLIKRLESVGLGMIAVHGRTKENKGVLTNKCDWESLRILKERSNIPFIANGGIFGYEDIDRCLEYTKADAVMVAESILENPWLFWGYKHPNEVRSKPSQFDVAREYLKICERHPPPNCGIIKTHLYRMFHTTFTLPGADIYRENINNSKSLEDFYLFLSNLKSFYYDKFRGESIRDYRGNVPELGFWYIRHRVDKLEHSVSRDLISIYKHCNQCLPPVLKFSESDMTNVTNSNNMNDESARQISTLFL